jgi:hypothetical protein
MSEIAKASDHIEPCNIEQSERHNRRDADYIASLNPKTLYIRQDLSPNNESYVTPDVEGQSLQELYEAIKMMVKQKTGRAMQERMVEYTDKKGKKKMRNGSSPLRESVVNIKPDTTMEDLRQYAQRVQDRWGVRAIQIHIHRDEGHYKDPENPETWMPNLHAHIIWDWMNHETGKSYKLSKKNMSELQDMAAETLEMERGKRKEETGAEHLIRTDFIRQKQEKDLQAIQGEIEKKKSELQEQKDEITKLSQASLYDKVVNAGLSPTVRMALKENEEKHKEELRQATTAVDAMGNPYVWQSGDKKGQVVTWEELAKILEKEKKKIEIQAKVDMKNALDKAEADKQTAIEKVKAEDKAELDAEIAEMKEVYGGIVEKERYAFSENGMPLYWSGGPKDGQRITKEERIKSLAEQLSKSRDTNKALLERLKVLRDLIFATCSLNFKKVVQIIVDQWKAGVKQFTKDLKDFFLNTMNSQETTIEGRKSFVEDAFFYAKLMAKTDPDLNLDNNALKPLYDDALKIADGTWESYHQKNDQLFEEAVKALVEMGNCPSQRHLNQKQADAIEAFISQNGGDRDMLCVNLWDAASPKIEYYWRDGTFDALEELRTGDLYNRKYGNGRSM